MLGVLGGMGPLATVDFMAKVIAATEAASDQDHVPMIVSSVPQIPDRTEAILTRGADPLPDMLRCVFMLERAGASLIAIPCNTAHFWHSRLAEFARVPVLNIVDACIEELQRHDRCARRVGLLATRGTIAAGIYVKRFADAQVVTPDDLDEVMLGIAAVKRGDLMQGTLHLERAADRLLDEGCDVIVMACTEIPIALAARAAREPDRFIDPTEALARMCVRRWEEGRTGAAPTRPVPATTFATARDEPVA